MYKKHVLFFGFVALLMAAIFTFVGCDNGSEDGSNEKAKPADDPAVKVYDDWKSDASNVQRLSINYRYDFSKMTPDDTYLWVRLQTRNKGDFVLLDYTDAKAPLRPNDSDQDKADGQIGASVKYSTGRNTNLETQGGGISYPTWEPDGSGTNPNSFPAPDLNTLLRYNPNTESRNTVLIPGLRGLLLYAVSPFWFKDIEAFSVNDPAISGNKVTVKFTHNNNTSVIWTNADGEIVFGNCNSSAPSCDSQLAAGWGLPLANPLPSDPASLEVGGPYMPFKAFRPYPVKADYLVSTASSSNGGRFSKKNIDWNRISPAMSTPGNPPGRASGYYYETKLDNPASKGKLVMDYQGTVLTIKGDLILKKVQ